MSFVQHATGLEHQFVSYQWGADMGGFWSDSSGPQIGQPSSPSSGTLGFIHMLKKQPGISPLFCKPE
jgi:hypothetical protein